jgi:ATP-dependent DNA helicase RecQ
VRTALTYLEMMGVLRQGTPFYAAYEVRPLRELAEIAGRFPGERGEFVSAIFAAAKKGRVWYAVDPAQVAGRLAQPRDRVVRALEYLQEQGLAELRASDVRQRYQRLRPDADAETLTGELVQRFTGRERQEIARLQAVLSLITHDGCQVNALVGHFGEVRERPCGHCTHCLTGERQRLPDPPARPALPAGLDVAAVSALGEEHPQALGEPRQVARFLCGLSSPRLSRARLGRHPLYGALEDRRFAEVLGWCLTR